MHPGGARRWGKVVCRGRRRDAVPVAAAEHDRAPRRHRRGEEPVERAVCRVDADATRRRVRLDVRRTRRGTIEPSVRPGRRPGQAELQGGQQT